MYKKHCMLVYSFLSLPAPKSLFNPSLYAHDSRQRERGGIDNNFQPKRFCGGKLGFESSGRLNVTRIKSTYIDVCLILS